MKLKKVFLFLACIALVMLVGFVSGMLTIEGVNGWYTKIEKPFFNPPNWIFGPVWSCLYFLLGISLFLILNTPKSPEKRQAIIVFVAQLTLNFFWSILFFYFHQIGWAFVEIISMFLSILWMIFVFKKIKPIAAYLQIPYAFWVSFASVLNGAIWFLN